MAFRLALPKLNLFGGKSSTVQARTGSAGSRLKLYGMTAGIFFVLTAIAAYMGNREENNNVRYVGQSSRLLMLTQRLAKDAQQALSGNSAAFDALAESKTNMSNILTSLDQGDSSLPATKGGARVALDTFIKEANKTLQNVQTLQDGRAGLVTLGATVATIDKVSTELRGLTHSMSETLEGGQKEQAVRLALSAERIGKDADRLLGVEVSVEQVAQLGIDTIAAEDSLAALPASDANVVRTQKLFEAYRGSVETLVSQVLNLVAAKSAAKAIVDDSDSLLAGAQHLVDAYQSSTSSRLITTAPLLLGLLLLLSLLMLFKTYADDSRQRAMEASRINS
ncbi:MAG: type IV pili methyl-accepting chemotaxis transducer N-terminal domain-containing protein, partial [Gallionella sp.]